MIDTSFVDGRPGVPDYEVTKFRPKGSRYLLAAFVLNEGARIGSQLEKMQPLAPLIDVAIADGGSTDGAVGDEALRSRDVAVRLVKRGPGRLSAQMRMAIHYAMLEGYDGIVVIDGNDKDDPAATPAFIDALDRGTDHVQGSRFIPGGKAVNTPWARYLGLRLLHAPLLSQAAGFHYTDTTNGFRAYSRRLLIDPWVAPLRDVFDRYELHYYLAIRSAQLGYNICELPVTRAYPAAGPTPTKIHGFRGNALILKTLLCACLEQYNPTPSEVRAACLT